MDKAQGLPSTLMEAIRYFADRDVAVEFHSLSKTYNMTGWRCGWSVARPEVARTLAKVKSFVDTGQFMAIQAAGVAALESWGGFVPQNVAIFKARRGAGGDGADRERAGRGSGV